MKKTKLFGWALVATMMGVSFSACSNDAEEVLAQESEIRLTSEITPSRVTSLDYQSTQIIEGQQVGVTIIGAKDEHNNVAWTVGQDGAMTTNNKAYWANSSVTITAYHPYDSDWTGTNEDFSVYNDQSSESNYLNSDLLWTSQTANKASGTAELVFKHLLSKINVTLQSTDITDLSNATIYICGTGTSTSVNLNTGVTTGASSENIIKAGITTNTQKTASAIVIPQTVNANKPFIRIEHNEKVYVYTLSSNTTFAPSTSYNYTLTLSKGTQVECVSSKITPWTDGGDINETIENETVVSVATSSAGDLSTKTGSGYLAIKTLKVTGDVNGADIMHIRDMAINGVLSDLDLSDAVIVADADGVTYEGNPMFGTFRTIENEIAFYMFYGCANLVKIKLPNTLTTIDLSDNFGGCNIRSITIPASVTSIQGDLGSCFEEILVEEGSQSFISEDGILFDKDRIGLMRFPSQKNVKNYTIPDGLLVVGLYAFRNNTFITEITIPSSVIGINNHAFEGCKNLSVVTCQSVNPPTVYEDVFNNIKTPNTLYVPEESLSSYQAADYWKNFTNIKPIPTE